MKVDHFAFLVKDINRAIDFYQDILGLKLKSHDRDEEHGEEFAFLELEGGNLELLQKLPPSTGDINPDSEERANCPHLALVSNDLDTLVEELKDKNIPLVKGPLSIPGKVNWLYFADPDGNIIEFVEWLNH